MQVFVLFDADAEGQIGGCAVGVFARADGVVGRELKSPLSSTHAMIIRTCERG